MADTKIIKGQAWIEGNCLVQEQILLVIGSKNTSYNTVVLIDDIWADLKSDSGTYKTNSKKDYFYWEVEMTDTENEDNYITVNFECPKPKDDLLRNPANAWKLIDKSEVKGDYATYWWNKLKLAEENYENSAAIQRKEVTFAGTQYVNQVGDTVTLDDIVFKNDDLSDISNLLNLF